MEPEEGEGEGEDDDEGDEGDEGGEGDGKGKDGEGTEGEGSPQKGTEGEDEPADTEGEGEGEGEEEPEEDDTEGEGDGDEPEDPEPTEGEPDEPEPEPEADFDWDIGQNMMDRWSDDVTSSGGQNWVVGTGQDEVLEEHEVPVSAGRRLAHHEQRHYQQLGAALAIRVKRALETHTLRFRRNRETGSIDPRNLYKVAAGLPNGFRKRLPTEATDTAIMLGLDASASMHNDSRFPLARDLMFVWNQALHRLKIPLMVYQWSTGFSNVNNVSGYDPKTNKWEHFLSRHYGLEIAILKDFDTPGNHPDTLARLNTYHTHNSTPTAEGLAFGLERLARRPEKKKILFFLTDGMPDACQRPQTVGHKARMAPHAKLIAETISEAKRRGVLVVVLGMDIDDERGYFNDNWLRVSSAKGFVNVTCNKLIRIIARWRV